MMTSVRWPGPPTAAEQYARQLPFWECWICGSMTLCAHREAELVVWVLSATEGEQYARILQAVRQRVA